MALLALQPWLVPLVLSAAVPLLIAVARGGELMFGFRRRMTEFERRRNYLYMLLSGKDAAKELRAFGLGGFLRERFDRLYDEHLAELRKVARRRLRVSLLGNLVTTVVLGPEFEGGKELSVGQWQRVALARAFFRDAPFIILDEPTAALDARAEHELFDSIRTLCRGRSVLLICHRFSSVRSADRIYVLDGGRVAESGSHDQLIALGGRYAELFTLQASAYLVSRSS